MSSFKNHTGFGHTGFGHTGFGQAGFGIGELIVFFIILALLFMAYLSTLTSQGVKGTIPGHIVCASDDSICIYCQENDGPICDN